jgi:anti-anti-sigma factor
MLLGSCAEGTARMFTTNGGGTVERPQSLSVEVLLPSASGCDLVRLRGELDLAGADFVVNLLGVVASSTVVIDLGGLNFIDGRGLSALLSARDHVEAKGHTLELRGATGIVRRAFEVADLAHLLGGPSRWPPEDPAAPRMAS